MEIEIEGQKYHAEIDSVSSRQADEIWYKEDFLMVSLSFNEPIEGLLGFAVRLPVKRYGKEEFLVKVKAEAEDGLSELLELDEEERERWMRGQERQEELDALVDEIKSEIGLLP